MVRKWPYRSGTSRHAAPEVSKSRWHVILKNACYAGRIIIPAYKDEPERNVEALHAPIVPPAVLDRVQVLLSPNKKERKMLPVEGFELREHLVCPVCGGRLTASRSTSRTGARYGYYHCLGHGTPGPNGRPDAPTTAWTVARPHGDKRHRADEANDAFYRSLITITVSPAVRAAYELVLQDLTRDGTEARSEKVRQLKSEISQLKEKLCAADERLIEGILSPEAYVRLRGRYNEELAATGDRGGRGYRQCYHARHRGLFGSGRRLEARHAGGASCAGWFHLAVRARLR